MRSHRNFATNRCYHLISRIAHRSFFLDDGEKTRLVECLWRAAEFSGVTVIAFCIMTNHIHVVAYVPDMEELSDDRSGYVEMTDPLHPRSSAQAYRLTARGRKVVA